MDFIFVTSNKNKLREVEEILERKVRHSSLEIPEIQSLDGVDVIKDKAVKAYEILKEPVVVEDTSLHIKVLNGFPGALVKWVLLNCGVERMCKLVRKGEDRSAYAEVHICLYDGKKFRFFAGRTNGSIAQSPRGQTGFGWDVLFIPEGYTKTYSQMDSELKNKISHRGKAFRKFKKFLEE
ncbi:MAG: RdgB/HAM1 family non-canonical purine NTP pyrophosphatase [Candidatus Micrarchaeales archaeon]